LNGYVLSHLPVRSGVVKGLSGGRLRLVVKAWEV